MCSKCLLMIIKFPMFLYLHVTIWLVGSLSGESIESRNFLLFDY